MTKPFPYALRLPVFAAPMFLISGPDLVVAACRAGVIGAFPTSNCRTVAELDQWIASICDRLDQAQGGSGDRTVAPWALNLITHSTNARLKDELALVARHKPPIVITALGSPLPVMDVVKSYGGLVFGDVVDIRLARKAAQAGVDGLACICAGAGGHTGHLSPFAFVSAVREFFDGYIVVGGGITDGSGLAGAIAAGADFAYLGTRFLAAREKSCGRCVQADGGRLRPGRSYRLGGRLRNAGLVAQAQPTGVRNRSECPRRTDSQELHPRGSGAEALARYVVRGTGTA